MAVRVVGHAQGRYFHFAARSLLQQMNTMVDDVKERMLDPPRIVMTESEVRELVQTVHGLLPGENAWEVHPFRVGAYNDLVPENLRIKFTRDTLGLIVLNTPYLFEGAFKQWLQAQQKPGDSFEEVIKKLPHPIFQFMDETLSAVPQHVSKYDLHFVNDYKNDPIRNPKVLTSVCGHVAGAAHYYRPDAVFQTPADVERAFPGRGNAPLFGLAIHPKFGGHFAYRGVYAVANGLLPTTFVDHPAPDVFNSDRAGAERCLVLFNSPNWRDDSSFRDANNPKERYSDLQIEFFSRPPEERWPLIRHWFR